MISKKLRKITVLSPHLDDAVLSCADYCLSKQRDGWTIHVISIFSKMDNNSFLEKRRKKEDKSAMNMLNFSFQYLDLYEAMYRSSIGKQLYPKQSYLNETIHEKDKVILQVLNKKLTNLDSEQTLMVPIGLGGHVDHILTRTSVETNFPSKQLIYYLDQPYALHLKNWRKSYAQVLRTLPAKVSFFTQSKQKNQALSCYKSQLKSLFPHQFYQNRYPEVLFTK